MFGVTEADLYDLYHGEDSNINMGIQGVDRLVKCYLIFGIQCLILLLKSTDIWNRYEVV